MEGRFDDAEAKTAADTPGLIKHRWCISIRDWAAKAVFIPEGLTVRFFSTGTAVSVPDANDLLGKGWTLLGKKSSGERLKDAGL